MTISKQDAEREAIRRWYALPANLRQTYEDAEIYASHLERELDFYTVTSKQRLIEAWLIREIHRAATREDDVRAA